MAFREISVVQIKEVLRLWLKGAGERTIAEAVGIDRKTVRRYLARVQELGLDRAGDDRQITDELIGQLVEQVRPHRPDGHGENWRTLLGEEARIKEWVQQDLTVTKIGILLARRGVVVPPRTLARFCVERLGSCHETLLEIRVEVDVRLVDEQVNASSTRRSAQGAL
jgi:transposase